MEATHEERLWINEASTFDGRIYFNTDVLFRLRAQDLRGPVVLRLDGCEIKARSEAAPLRALDRTLQAPARKDGFGALLYADAIPCGDHEFMVRVKPDKANASKVRAPTADEPKDRRRLTVTVGSREVVAANVHATHPLPQSKRKRPTKKLRQHEAMEVEAGMHLNEGGLSLGFESNQRQEKLFPHALGETVAHGPFLQTNGGHHPHHHHPTESPVPNVTAHLVPYDYTDGAHETAFGGPPMAQASFEDGAQALSWLEEFLELDLRHTQPAQAPPTAQEKGKEKAESEAPAEEGEGEGEAYLAPGTGDHQARDAMARDTAPARGATVERPRQWGATEDEASEQSRGRRAPGHEREVEDLEDLRAMGRRLDIVELPGALAKWYRHALGRHPAPSRRSLAEAEWLMGSLLEAGADKNSPHLPEAEERYRKAAEEDHVLALCRLGAIYEEGDDHEKAVRLYKRAAKLGDPIGQWLLGRMWAAGRGVPQPDGEEAMRWFLRAAQQQDSDGMWRLARICETGADRDYEKAVHWYRQAILARNDPNAHWLLGCMHATGRGVPADLEQAVAHHRLAVKKGPVASWWLTSWLDAMRSDVPRDYRQAIKWYRQAAADAGHSVDAQWLLGFVHEDGRGVRRDCKEAAEWYRLAADRGDADAQWRLGRLLDEGPDGVACDPAQAAEWYTRAVQQRHPKACCSLGVLHESGRGVQRNLAQAVALYRLAADQGDKDAASRLERLRD